MASRKDNQSTDDDQKSAMGIGSVFPVLADEPYTGRFEEGSDDYKTEAGSYQSVPGSIKWLPRTDNDGGR